MFSLCSAASCTQGEDGASSSTLITSNAGGSQGEQGASACLTTAGPTGQGLGLSLLKTRKLSQLNNVFSSLRKRQ